MGLQPRQERRQIDRPDGGPRRPVANAAVKVRAHVQFSQVPWFAGDHVMVGRPKNMRPVVVDEQKDEACQFAN